MSIIKLFKKYIKKIRTKLKVNKYHKKYNFTCDKSSILNTSFKIRGTKNATINIGKDNVLYNKITFEHPDAIVNIGDRCYINKKTQFISINNIDIGNDVTIAWDVTLFDHNAHSFDWEERRKDIKISHDGLLNKKTEEKDWSVVKSAPIKICDKVWIGFGSTILKGVTIGEGAIIGANSVVRENVKPWTVVAGNPAVKVGEVRH